MVCLLVITTLVCCLAPLRALAQNSGSNNSVNVFLQQASQLPVFDLNAAWAAALAHGVVSPSTIKARSEPSTALLRVTIEKAQVFVIDVPEGLYTASGNISVGQGQLLVLQGHGGLLDGPSNSTQQLPMSTLVLGNTSTASINILSGGAVYARNLTLVAPRLGPLGSATTFIPTPFVMPSNPWAAALAMESVAIIADDCTHLQALQAYLCGVLTQDSDVPWPTVEIEPGWLFLDSLQAQLANVSIAGMLWACSWPPPHMRESIRSSVRHVSEPDVPAGQLSDVYAHSVLHLSPAGIPNNTLAPLPSPANMTAGQGAQQLGCVVRHVHTSSQLERALVELQAMSTEFVVIQIRANITLQPQGLGAMWPADDNAVRIYRNVTIMGRHPVRELITEIDFNKLRNIFWVEQTGQLRFQQLTLANLPCGPKEYFPASLLIVMVWSVAWNRSLETDHHFFLEIKNSSLTLTREQFSYASYWVGIQTSPVPKVREQAAWVDIPFNGSMLVLNDSHTIFLQRRWATGIQWLNTSMTDSTVVAPNKHGPAGCGVTSLVPGNPYFPYTHITPVYDAQQLAVYLENPPTPLLMLANNITFSVAQARAAHSGATGVGNSTNSSAAAGTLDHASIAAQAQLNMSTGLLDDGVVNVTQGVTLLGWYEGTTVLDLGNAADLVQLNLPAEQQLAIKRLTLAGLGPAAPGQQPAELGNFTAALWAFDFDRRREVLALQNVTMLVPEVQLSMLQAHAMNASALPAPAPAAAPASPATNTTVKPSAPNSSTATPVDLDMPSGFSAVWASASWEVQVRNSTPGLVNVATATWNGIEAADVILTAALGPALVAALNITPLPQDLAVQELSEGGSSGLSKWQAALLGVGVGATVLAASSLLTCWALWRCKRHQHRCQADKEAAEAVDPRPSPTAPPDHPESPRRSLDDEIRQLVSLQRERVRNNTGGVLGSTPALDGVTLEGILGQGSFGMVYLGRWRGMTVAVKTITFNDVVAAGRPSSRQRAVNEAAVNTLLSHECICNMYAYDLRPTPPTGLPDEQFSARYCLYIIQEYCDAGSLAKAIDRGLFTDNYGRRKLLAILEVAHEIARGLAYIHENQVIHGDLSSDNVMLRSAPATRLGFQAKVCDFGLSRFLGGSGESHISGVHQGTPYYTAPEVLAQGTISREACSFSFGVILWELIHARCPPWRDPDVIDAAWLRRIQRQLPGGQGSAGASAPATGVGAPAGPITGTATSQTIRQIGQSRQAALLLSPPDLCNPSAFTYPLPLDCPPAYAALVTSCLQRNPKVRPSLRDVVAGLGQMMEDAGVPPQVMAAATSSSHPALQPALRAAGTAAFPGRAVVQMPQDAAAGAGGEVRSGLGLQEGIQAGLVVVNPAGSLSTERTASAEEPAEASAPAASEAEASAPAASERPPVGAPPEPGASPSARAASGTAFGAQGLARMPSITRSRSSDAAPGRPDISMPSSDTAGLQHGAAISATTPYNIGSDQFNTAERNLGDLGEEQIQSLDTPTSMLRRHQSRSL